MDRPATWTPELDLYKTASGTCNFRMMCDSRHGMVSFVDTHQMANSVEQMETEGPGDAKLSAEDDGGTEVHVLKI